MQRLLDIGASAKLELADKFCYLCDMLSVDGDADVAVEARIRMSMYIGAKTVVRTVYGRHVECGWRR